MENRSTTSAGIFRGNFQRTGFFDEQVSVANLKVKWTHQSRRKINSAPVAVDNTVFFGTNEKSVLALDQAMGALLWQHAVSRNVTASPLVWQDDVYIGGRDGVFFALDRKTGQEKWRFDTQLPLSQSSAATESLVILSNNGFWHKDKTGYMFGVNRHNGEVQWHWPMAEGFAAAPTLSADNKIGYSGSRNQLMHAFDLESGEILWEFQAGGEVLSTAALAENRLYFCCTDKCIYCVELDGRLSWRLETGFPLYGSSPAVEGGVLYAGTTDGRLIAADAHSGELLHEIKVDGEQEPTTFYSPSITAEHVFAGNSDGDLYVVERASFKVVAKLKTENEVPWTSIFIADGGLYFGGSGKRLYSIG
ncbi:MAG: PQQ-binding-like beta-propeller repeat protein [Anaerolineae bacterium]